MKNDTAITMIKLAVAFIMRKLELDCLEADPVQFYMWENLSVSTFCYC